MADPQTDAPQDIEKPVSVDDIYKQQDAARPRVRIQTRNKEPQDIDKPISVDDIYSKFGDQFKTDQKKPDNDVFKKGLISDENKRLGYTQGTHQVPNKDSYVGPAVSGKDLFGAGDDDPDKDTNYIKDDKGNYQAADKNNHVMFRDPDSGEYGIYNRDHAQNMSGVNRVLGGLGSVVQEGFQATPGVSSQASSTLRNGFLTMGREAPASKAASATGEGPNLTRGQEALEAQGRVEDTTGAHVPVPQNVVTENKITPALTKGLEALPGGSAPFDAAAGRMEGGLANAANRATEGATTAEEAGSTARNAIEATAKPKEGVLAQRVSDAYDKVDAHVPPDATRDLSNTRAVAQDLQSRYEATGQAGYNPTISKVFGAVTDPKGITYQGLKDLRSELGEMLESGTKISETGISDKQLRGLYKGLTDDMRGMVSEHGGARGLQLWERANNFARLASERRETLGKVLGTTRSDEGILSTIERMAGSTSSADAKTLSVAKKSIPADEWNEIASTVASRLGKVKTDQGTHFDPNKFVKDYDKMSERGKSLLFGDQQRLRKALDSISDLSKFTEPVSHPGPLAHLVVAGTVLNHAGGGEGVLGRLGHIVAGVASMKVLGNMLSKPATAESVAKWMQGYKLAILKPTKGNVSLFQRASESLANDAAKEDRERIGQGAAWTADLAKKLITLIPFPGK